MQEFIKSNSEEKYGKQEDATNAKYAKTAKLLTMQRIKNCHHAKNVKKAEVVIKQRMQRAERVL